jgi:hypothetical protein
MGLFRLLGRLLLESLRSSEARRTKPRFAGYDGEWLDPNVYHQFKGLVVPTSRGSAEIDHLIVSKYGLFVIELKDYSGWIFGDKADAKWTAVHFKKKFWFQNPLRQNFSHVMALQELLGIGRDKMHQAVVFRGDFEFKTPIPAGVLCHDYRSWVESHTRVLLLDDEVTRAAMTLKKIADDEPISIETHIDTLRERFSSDSVCPVCGGELRVLLARQGPKPGSSFLGCSNYPDCDFTKNS